MYRKRVAIIGGGASGLTAIKCCLDEGLDPICFEKQAEIGGLWNYSDEPKLGTGSVYKSCVINTSKEMFAFSDFPVPPEFPPFMPHRYVLKYLYMYADHFNLARHIRFATRVEYIRKAPKYEENGKWEIGHRKTEAEEGQVDEETFDAVMMCTGHHAYPTTPDMHNKDKFQGIKLHSRDYKIPEPFAEKNVLVVGIGNSAVDIAVDLSRVASQVYLSTRRGAWIVGKMGPLGIPMDLLANSRFAFFFPRSWLQKVVEVFTNYKFDHDNFGLRPTHRVLEAHPTINDDLPLRILTGSVKVKPDVASFTSSTVTFGDGTEEQIDAVIFATGYDYSSKIMDHDVIDMKDNKASLYKFMFPPTLRHPSLAMIGLVQPVGAVLPVAEMQCRWFTRIIKGNASLPDEATMMADVMNKRQFMDRSYYKSKKHSCETFWIEYMDEIAQQFRCRPNLWRMVFTDPRLAARCFFGPCVPAQYRLQGPGSWSSAKHTICNAFSNTTSVTRTRKVVNVPVARSSLLTDILLWLLVIAIFKCLYDIGAFF